MHSSTKHNFFQRFFASFFSPTFYIQAIQEPLSKAIRYALLLTAILSLIGGFFLALQVKESFRYTYAFLSDNRFPNIAISNGKLQLSAENDIELKIGENLDFIAILDSDDIGNHTQIRRYEFGIYVTPDYLLLQRKNFSPLIIKFASIGNIQLEKSYFIDILKTSEIISYIVTFLFYFVQLSFQYFFKALVIYVIILWTFPIIQVKELDIKRSQVYAVVLYAMSFANLVLEVFYIFNFTNQLIMSISIIVFYMMTIKIAKNGLIAIVLEKAGEIRLPKDDDFDEYF